MLVEHFVRWRLRAPGQMHPNICDLDRIVFILVRQ